MANFCTYCGEKIEKKEGFCPFCGNKVIEEEEENVYPLKVMSKEEKERYWEKVYRETYAKAYSVAIQVLKNEDDALDILQDAYLSAYHKLDTLRDEAKIGAWINRIVANRCIDLLRKRNRENKKNFSEMQLEDSDLDYEDNLENDKMEFMPEESVDYGATKKIMQGILSSLSDEQRLCILMYYYEEMSIAEIAEALDCSTGTVKSRLNYARKYIKTEVESLEKKGTKLYNIAPLPFILWMLRSGEKSVHIPENGAQMLSNAVGSTATSTIENVSKEATREAAKDVAKESTKEAVKEVVKTGAKAGTKKVAAKIIAGVVATAVIGTSGYQAVKYTSEQKAVQQAELQEKKEEEKKREEEKKAAAEAEAEAERLKEQFSQTMATVDYDFLANVVTYLPDYSVEQPLSESELLEIYTDALLYGVQYQTLDGKDYDFGLYEKWKYEVDSRQIIPETELLSVDKETRTGVYAMSAFDQFMQVTGTTKSLADLSSNYTQGDNYVMQRSGAIPVECRCEFVRSTVDFENEELIIHYELITYPEGYEQISDPREEEVIRSPKTMVVKLADNELGYQIATIENGYREITMQAEWLVKNINRDSSEVMELLEEKTGDSSLNTDKLYTTTKYFLRAETDPTTDKVCVRYLSVDYLDVYEDHGDVDITSMDLFTNFQRGVITLAPQKSVYGYVIEDNSLEPWTDNYAIDMQSREASAINISSTLNADSEYVSDYMHSYGQELGYWEEQVEEVLRRVKEEHPEYSDLLTSDWENYQKCTDEAAADEMSRWGGNAYGIGASNALTLSMDNTKARVYYYVGNYLMDGKLELLNNK